MIWKIVRIFWKIGKIELKIGKLGSLDPTFSRLWIQVKMKQSVPLRSKAFLGFPQAFLENLGYFGFVNCVVRNVRLPCVAPCVLPLPLIGGHRLYNKWRRFPAHTVRY